MELLTADMLQRALALVDKGYAPRAVHILAETRSILRGLGKRSLPPIPGESPSNTSAPAGPFSTTHPAAPPFTFTSTSALGPAPGRLSQFKTPSSLTFPPASSSLADRLQFARPTSALASASPAATLATSGRHTPSPPSSSSKPSASTSMLPLSSALPTTTVPAPALPSAHPSNPPSPPPPSFTTSLDPPTTAALDACLAAASEWLAHPDIFARDARKSALQAIGVISTQRGFVLKTDGELEGLYASRIPGVRRSVERSRAWRGEGGNGVGGGVGVNGNRNVVEGGMF